MAITLQLAGADSKRMHAVISPMAELMALLHVLAEPEHHMEAKEALTTVSKALVPSTVDEFNILSPLWARFRCRLLFPLGLAPNNTFESEVLALRNLPLESFVGMAAEAIYGFSRRLPAPAGLMHEPDSRREFIELCRTRSQGRFELAEVLLRSPDAFRSRLLGFLTDCHNSFFAREWERVSGELQRAAASVAGRLRTSDPVSVLSSLSVTAKAYPELAEVRFDKLQQRRINAADQDMILIPSVWIGAHLTVKDSSGYPVVIHFPAAQPDRERLSIRQVRNRLAALSSEARMELFRHISAEATTTSELSVRLGQPAAQVSRSLGVLKEAGLVLSERRGKQVYHRINAEAVLNLGPDILATLMR